MNPVAVDLSRPNENVEPGRYGSMIPVTPANGMTLICRTKPGSGDAIRAAGAAIEKVVQDDPHALAVLRLHFARWILFDDDTRFIYMAIFDTDFDKYAEDVLSLFKSMESKGVTPFFSYLEGFPEDWKENPVAFAKWAGEVHAPSFAEYAEYPGVTGVEVVKALTVKQGLSEVLDQMQ
jgi:hypothetical protein